MSIGPTLGTTVEKARMRRVLKMMVIFFIGFLIKNILFGEDYNTLYY